MSVALAYDPIFLNHDTGAGHPERSARLQHGYQLLQQQAWFGELQQVTIAAAAPRWVAEVHGEQYIDRLAAQIAEGVQYIDTPDVAVSSASYEVALNASGALLAVCDKVLGNSCHSGFAMIRPPGHHAEADMAMGFCLFNNVAIAARYCQQQYGAKRVAIVDWDVHHGNGTQHIFERDADVMYLSLHQSPHYPGTGAASERGIDGGVGSTVNCPMDAGAGDKDYQLAFKQVIIPQLQQFAPEVILISAGFDAHQADPLGSINLSTQSYRWMTEQLREVAEQSANGKVISCLEGGYDLDALAASMRTHIDALR